MSYRNRLLVLADISSTSPGHKLTRHVKPPIQHISDDISYNKLIIAHSVYYHAH